MGELTILSYAVLQSEEVSDLFADTVKIDRPLKLDLPGGGGRVGSASGPTRSSMTSTIGGS